MGWSLKGILAGAGKGMADWAGREIAAEKQAERDAAQFERQKEMSRYNDELAGAREERSLELKDKFLEKKAEQERTRETETLRLGDEDAKAAGLKPGSKEYNLFMGDFLRQSNFTALGEKYVAQADKFDDNDLKRQQIAAQLAGVAESRRGRDDARTQAADAKQFALDAKQIETLGTFALRKPDPDNPDKTLTIEDKSGQAALISIYQRSADDKGRGNMELVSEAASAGQAMFSANPKQYPNLGAAIKAYEVAQIKKEEEKKKASSGGAGPAPAPVQAAPPASAKLGDGSLVKQIPK